MKIWVMQQSHSIQSGLKGVVKKYPGNICCHCHTPPCSQQLQHHLKKRKEGEMALIERAEKKMTTALLSFWND